MNKFIVFQNQLDSERFLKSISEKLGYPKQGLNKGRGIHTRNCDTPYYSWIVKHKNQNKWAVFIDNNSRKFVDKGVSEEELSKEWFEKKPTAALIV